MIESGWKCTADQPSRCGTIDCMTHGQSYISTNIYGTCCSGLGNRKVQLDISGGSGSTLPSYTICSDSLIDEPICLRESGKPEGRYIKKQKDAAPELILPGVCTVAYKDYYGMLSASIKEKNNYCSYTDINYDKVDFRDI